MCGREPLKKGNTSTKVRKTNPIPSLLIAIKGERIMIIDGKKRKFTEGNATLIPPGVAHEFQNPGQEALPECILLMLGEGA